MIDKELFKLIGKNKKYIFIAVALQVLGLVANVGITASICWAIYFAITKAEPIMYLYPAICAVVGIAVRYTMTRLTGDIKDVLGRRVKKDLRERTYNKIVKLGVRSTDGMSMAGLTQVSMEGVEQLDLYYSSYLPQFFFAMLAPIILFAICVWIDWYRLSPCPLSRYRSMQKRYSQSIGASTRRWAINSLTACKA